VQKEQERISRSSDTYHSSESHVGMVTGAIRRDSDGYAYAVRYAPGTTVTESLIRKSWSESRTGFRRYDDSTDCFLTVHSRSWA
jgi:hypothetical protein